jgi:hypothetical protein
VLIARNTKPLSIKEDTGDVVVTVGVSGTFDGSSVTLDSHFTIENEKISYVSELISEPMGLIHSLGLNNQ